MPGSVPGVPSLRDHRGQAAVELVALLPLLGVLAALAWQAVVAGQAVWLSGAAARAAARASAVGGDAAAVSAAARGVAAGAGARVRAPGDVEVAVPVRLVVVGARLGTVRARARFAPQGG